MKTDSRFKHDVIEKLKWEPTVTSSDIEVAAKTGIVMRSGTVPHYAKQYAAERTAQRVEDVKAISNNITLDPKPSPIARSIYILEM